MREIPVCTDNWNGVKSEQFIWHNPDHSNAVTISQVGAGWPFTLSSPITVAAGAKLQCGLTGQGGSFNYNANPCKTRGNPKTVIIS